MRISDWSSDVCSSDLSNAARSPATPRSKSDSVGHHSSRAPMNGEVPLCTASIANERTCRNAPMRSPSALRSEEHTSELQSLMRISYAVFCLKKKQKLVEMTPYTTIQKTYIEHRHRALMYK